MPEFFVYLFKINIAISLFYVGYYVLLRKLTFYSLNRFYLLFSIIISAIFPFLRIPSIFSKPEIISYNFQVVEGTIESLPQIEESQSMVWLVLTVAYWLLVLFGGLKFSTRLISLYRIHLKSSAKHWEGYRFNDLSLEITPFSFLKNTYLNFNNHTEKELHTILQHEQVHTKSLHSLDILIIEIWSLFSWFNPLSWLLKKTIKVNSEFIADHEVVKQGASHQHYQKSLLDFAIHTYDIPLTNQFSFISLKSRIAMMNKKQSSKKQLGVYFLVIPIIIVSLFSFGISNGHQRVESLDVFLQEESLQHELNQDSTTIEKPQTQAFSEIFGDTSRLNTEKALIIIDGVEQEKINGKSNLSIISPEAIESLSILKGQAAIAIYGKKGKDGVILITTKAEKESVTQNRPQNRLWKIIEEPKSEDSKSDGTVIEGINGSEEAVIKGKSLDGDTDNAVKVQGYSTKTLEARSDNGTDTAVVVRGYGTIQKSNSEEHGISVSGIDASLKGSTSILGFNIRGISKGKDRPLILIDGKEVEEEAMKKINSDKIESFSVLKDKEALKRYEEKGKNGVILITLKKDAPL